MEEMGPQELTSGPSLASLHRVHDLEVLIHELVERQVAPDGERHRGLQTELRGRPDAFPLVDERLVGRRLHDPVMEVAVGVGVRPPVVGVVRVAGTFGEAGELVEVLGPSGREFAPVLLENRSDLVRLEHLALVDAPDPGAAVRLGHNKSLCR
ncbi:MAG: hypothetical protein CMJ31_01290 [Phycisphaerae bacterium]|nr:hypothetical protein [Phycisphaerae bacterium]